MTENTVSPGLKYWLKVLPQMVKPLAEWISGVIRQFNGEVLLGVVIGEKIVSTQFDIPIRDKLMLC